MVAIVLVASVCSAMAQKGEKAVGLQLNYGTQIESMGIGAKFQYGITNAIRLEPSFNYFFGGKSSVSCPLKPSDSAPLKHSTMPP